MANRREVEEVVYGTWAGRMFYRLRHLLNRNSRANSRKNVHAHYDLGNAFYGLWLDGTMNYSSALFDGDLAQSMETAQDAKVLAEGAGELANGFISVGGASTPEIRSPAMEEFIAAYTKKFGEYNDESNTKVYALEYILDTMKANPKAIDNVDEFKKTMDNFSAPNPYLKGDKTIKYVGTTSFGQKRQVSVPMVVNEYKDGKFVTMFVGEVD